MSTPLTTVFVYGTLMPGERNAHVAQRGGPFTARPATLRGYRLFYLTPEAYPGLITGNEENMVRGYTLTYASSDWDRARSFLDGLEGLDETPPLYTREQTQVDHEDGSYSHAWVYVYARADRLHAPGVHFIQSGDWREASKRDPHEATD